ncbi:hypothetical protein GOODEAATRI_032114, partial [Goodea atripinnis]
MADLDFGNWPMPTRIWGLFKEIRLVPNHIPNRKPKIKRTNGYIEPCTVHSFSCEQTVDYVEEPVWLKSCLSDCKQPTPKIIPLDPYWTSCPPNNWPTYWLFEAGN